MKNIGCKTRIKIRRADVSHMYHFQNTYDLRGERLFPIEFVASQSDWIWKWLAEIRWVGCFTPEKGRGKNLVPFHILLIVFLCHIWVYFTMCEAMFAFCGLLWVFLHGGIFSWFLDSLFHGCYRENLGPVHIFWVVCIWARFYCFFQWGRVRNSS